MEEVDFQRIVLWDVIQERQRQDRKWGIQNHPPLRYLAILMEEVGELAEAIVQTTDPKDNNGKGGFENIRKEATHVAAVAVAFLECLDRSRE